MWKLPHQDLVVGPGAEAVPQDVQVLVHLHRRLVGQGNGPVALEDTVRQVHPVADVQQDPVRRQAVELLLDGRHVPVEVRRRPPLGRPGGRVAPSQGRPAAPAGRS